MTPELLAHLVVQTATQAHAAPLEAMRQQQELHLQSMKMMQDQNILAMQMLATNNPAADPLRKLREKDPQFPPFTGRTADFLRWVLECQTRKEQRGLDDQVAIQYATIAMGDSIRGLFPSDHHHTTWTEFVAALRPKFQLSTADWALYMETQTWKMNGDWPRFHTMITAYRQFVDKALEPALMLHMINGLDPYLMRKVVKEPRPQTLDDAIKKTWEVFRTSPPPLPSYQTPSSHYGSSSTQRPMQQQVPTQMELDFVRPMPQGNQTFQVSRPANNSATMRFNAFSGSPLQQTFGHYAPTSDDVFNVVQSSSQEPPREPEKHREEQQQPRRPSSPDRRPQRNFSNSSRDRQRFSENRDYQSRQPPRRTRSPREPEYPRNRERSYSGDQKERPRRSYEAHREQARSPPRDSRDRGRQNAERRDRPRTPSREGRPSSRPDRDEKYPRSSARKDVACYHCGKPGHYVHDCPLKQPRRDPSPGQSPRRSYTPPTPQRSRTPPTPTRTHSGNPNGR